MTTFLIGVAIFLFGLVTSSSGFYSINKFWYFICGFCLWMGLLIIALSSFFILVYGA